MAAGAGLKVAKHGTRAISSKSGSSDVLTALGVNIAGQPGAAAARAGRGRHLLPVRAGPPRRHAPRAADPPGARLPHHLQSAGAAVQSRRRAAPGGGRRSTPRWVEPMARVLGALGAERAWVVHGEGLDETDHDRRDRGRRMARRRRAPVQRHARGRRPAARGAGRPARRRAGRTTPRRCAPCWAARRGAYRDIVLLNAAAALLVADKVETLREGVALAAEAHRRRAAPPRRWTGWSRPPTRPDERHPRRASPPTSATRSRAPRRAERQDARSRRARAGRLAAARLPRRPGARPRARAPGADRRDQEGLAVQGPDPRRLRPAGAGRAPTRRAARPASRC